MSYFLATDLSVALEKQRQDVHQTAYLCAHRLSDEANSAYYLAGGMASYISAAPDISPEEFSKLAASIVARKDVFRNIAGAPNLVINNVYPLEGNEKAIGLDYNTVPDQLKGIQRAIKTKAAVLDGPMKLVQGGEGFIARFPVYYDDAGKEKFWGIISTVIDTPKLYEMSGLTNPDLPINIALRGNGSTDGKEAYFFGDPNIDDKNPIILPINIPGGEWVLAAAPKDGWLVQSPNYYTIIGFSTLILGLYFLAAFAIQLYINRLAHSREIADAANRMKSRFIANMSHEMRTPLNGIMGYASLLQQSDLSEEQASHAENLSQAVTALLTISNDILDLAKLEMGQLTLNIHTFNVNDIIDEAIKLNINKAKEKGVYIKAKYDTSCHDFAITTDGNRLRQIISNLIDNAVKFTNEGGITIDVIKSDNGDDLIIEVADTGIGIHQDHIDRIFERFEQIEDIYSRNHGGAGLGLSICRELIQVLDGKLELESVVGTGTKARITVPLQNKQTPSDSI